jgi:hypothetical protein
MKRGVPPTALKARTGELTPPGVTVDARAKSSAEAVVSRGLTLPIVPERPHADESSPRRPDVSLVNPHLGEI